MALNELPAYLASSTEPAQAAGAISIAPTPAVSPMVISRAVARRVSRTATMSPIPITAATTITIRSQGRKVP